MFFVKLNKNMLLSAVTGRFVVIAFHHQKKGILVAKPPQCRYNRYNSTDKDRKCKEEKV